MREIRLSGSEGGESGQPDFPTPIEAIHPDCGACPEPDLRISQRARPLLPQLYSYTAPAGQPFNVQRWTFDVQQRISPSCKPLPWPGASPNGPPKKKLSCSAKKTAKTKSYKSTTKTSSKTKTSAKTSPLKPMTPSLFPKGFGFSGFVVRWVELKRMAMHPMPRKGRVSLARGFNPGTGNTTPPSPGGAM